MAEFHLDKLVRVGRIEQYKELGQEPEIIEKTPQEKILELLRKIREEAAEFDPDSSPEEKAGELGDMMQAIDDLIAECGLNPELVVTAKQEKFRELGGFAVYVGRLKLQDDDPWNSYYRKKPDVFPEVKDDL
jgi:predicted house-cleaning noncanonical NTP pyrophosphatase (MazG superfamily)